MITMEQIKAIRQLFREHESPPPKIMLISERTAEHVKVTLGSAFRLKEEMTLTVQGFNLVRRLPEVLELSSVEIREALANSVRMISETMKDAIAAVDDRDSRCNEDQTGYQPEGYPLREQQAAQTNARNRGDKGQYLAGYAICIDSECQCSNRQRCGSGCDYLPGNDFV